MHAKLAWMHSYMLLLTARAVAGCMMPDALSDWERKRGGPLGGGGGWGTGASYWRERAPYQGPNTNYRLHTMCTVEVYSNTVLEKLNLTARP